MFEIGTTLREARVRRRLTLQQAEEDTKIRVKYLQAMENEDFDIMPSPAYVKGFLRTYATHLGLDPAIILEEYHSRFEPREEHDAFGGSSAIHPRRHARRNTLAFVAVVCLLVLALVYVLGVYNAPQDEPPPGPANSLTPSPSPSVSKTPKPSPSPSVVVLKVTADRGASYLEVRRGTASGKVLFKATLFKGRTHTFRNKGPLFVRLGQPMLVKLAANGKAARRPIQTTATDYRVTLRGVARL